MPQARQEPSGPNRKRAERDHQLARLQDPTGFSGYVSACKTEAQRVDALSKLNTAIVRAQKARQAAVKANISDSFYWWRMLCGDPFSVVQ